jgi:ATP-dependent DNA helicase DinG
LKPGGRLERSGRLPRCEFRAEQAEASHAVEEAFQTGRPGLIEAGTGVGKSLAYLIPAVRAAALGKKTVISTHTLNLQAQLLEKDIPLVQSLLKEVKVKAVAMKGRGNYLCRQDLDAAEADLFHATDPLFRELKRWARKSDTGDVAELPFVYSNWFEVAANQDTCRSKDCHYFDRCFYYRMRREAGDANLIVVNHALFLSDLMVRREEPESSILPDYDYVVFDEAHHLEDVATKVFGLELTNSRIPRFVDRLRRTKGLTVNSERLSSLERLNEELFGAFQHDRQEFFFEDALGEEGDAVAKGVTTRLLATLDELNKEILEEAKEAEPPIKERLQGFSRMAGRLREELDLLIFQEQPDVIRWGARGEFRARGRAKAEPRTTLHVTPIQIGPLMDEMLWRNVGSAVLMSATLSNSGGFSYIRSRLGVPEPAVERVVGSPFDFKQQAMLYVPGHLPEPPKQSVPSYTEALANEIERIVSLSEGRAFLLFTSRRMLNEVYALLEEKLPYPLFRQGDMPPARLLDAFRESGNGCLFGTQTFWEGVDVQGEALSCVIIDRLPFAVPDSPVTRARTEAISAAGGDWFSEFSIPQAQIRLKQGFGRLIRTHADRGIVCILDKRLMSKGYGKEFVKHLPPASRASLWPRVERFWKEPGQLEGPPGHQ